MAKTYLGEEAGRRYLRAFVIMAAVTAAIAIVFAAVAFNSYRHERVLDVRGVRSEAVVVDRAHYSRGTDTVTVEFPTATGEPGRARMPVDDATAFPLGSQIEIIYDPLHPSHARPKSGWSPAYQGDSAIAFLIAAFGVGLLAWAWQWVHRVRRFAADPGHPRTPVEIFTWDGTRGTRYASAYEKGDLLAGPPRFTVRLMPGQLDHDVSGPAEVIGVPRPGNIVLLRTSKGTLWPAAKTRGPHRRLRKALAKLPDHSVPNLVHPDASQTAGPFASDRAAAWHRLAFVLAMVLVGVAFVVAWLVRP